MCAYVLYVRFYDVDLSYGENYLRRWLILVGAEGVFACIVVWSKFVTTHYSIYCLPDCHLYLLLSSD